MPASAVLADFPTKDAYFVPFLLFVVETDVLDSPLTKIAPLPHYHAIPLCFVAKRRPQKSLPIGTLPAFTNCMNIMNPLPINRQHNHKYGILLGALFSLTSLLNATTVSIAWDPPSSYTDGSALTDLAGYRLYHGTASGVYTDNTVIDNVTGLSLTNLPSGRTHYFAISAYTSSGTEGARSDELAVPIPPAITLSTVSISITEGTSSTVRVRLEAPPIHATTVQVNRATGSDPYLGITAGAQLLFSPTNWSTDQTVTLTALPDPTRTIRTALFDFSGADLLSAQLTAATLAANVIPTELIDQQDLNANGIPDTWEITRFGGLNLPGTAANEDTDHDGCSNIQEYIAGTDPSDPSSRLQVEIQANAETTEISVQTIAPSGYGYLGKTRTYTLLQSADLAAGTWASVPAATDIPATGQKLTHADEANTAPSSFYRVSAQLQ